MKIHPKRRDQPMRGAFFVIGYALMMSCLGSFVKLISAELPFEMIVFFRNLFALVLLSVFLFKRNGVNPLRTRVFKFHMIRSLAGVTAMYCFFYALGKMPLGEAILLSYTAPVFIPLIAWMWLKETVSRKNIFAVFLGFTGIAVILKPGSGIFNPAGFAGITAGIMVAVGVVTIRRMSDTESPGAMVFYFTLISTLVSAVPLLWAWQQPDNRQLLLLCLMGGIAVFGQYLATRGYAVAPAAQVGPFTYATVVFSALLGWVFWCEALDLFFGVGAVLITIAGVIAIRSKVV